MWMWMYMSRKARETGGKNSIGCARGCAKRAREQSASLATMGAYPSMPPTSLVSLISSGLFLFLSHVVMAVTSQGWGVYIECKILVDSRGRSPNLGG